MPRHPDVFGGVAAALLGLVVIAAAQTTPDPGFGVVGPAALPTIFGVVIVLSGVWIAAGALRSDPPALEPFDARPFALATAATAVYFVAFVPIGFIVTSIAFVLAVARILGSRALVRDLVVSIAFVLGLYVVFTQLLTVDLPRGLLAF
ncbi:MAG TPA: tripartite tricarboxylate transporter TctB family protein [Candidatus Limnocylindria bacterium]|nr:tripartite tricarboxylate transporter TctB family protein [Candidatus Limnocylindria bacterium]